MSTTDTRAAFEAWAELTTAQTKGALHEVIGWYYFDDLTNDRWEAWQAATEAAKATGTAGELKELAKRIRDELDTDDSNQEYRIGYRAATADAAALVEHAEAARQPAPVVIPYMPEDITTDDALWRAGCKAFRAALNEMTGRDGYVVKKTYEALREHILAATNRSQP